MLINGIRNRDFGINIPRNENNNIIGINQNLSINNQINMPQNNTMKIKLNKKDGYSMGNTKINESANQIKEDIIMKDYSKKK